MQRDVRARSCVDFDIPTSRGDLVPGWQLDLPEDEARGLEAKGWVEIDGEETAPKPKPRGRGPRRYTNQHEGGFTRQE